MWITTALHVQLRVSTALSLLCWNYIGIDYQPRQI